MNNQLFFKNIVTKSGNIVECFLPTEDMFKSKSKPNTTHGEDGFTFFPKCNFVDEVSSLFLSEYIPVCTIDLPVLPEEQLQITLKKEVHSFQ